MVRFLVVVLRLRDQVRALQRAALLVGAGLAEKLPRRHHLLRPAALCFLIDLLLQLFTVIPFILMFELIAPNDNLFCRIFSINVLHHCHLTIRHLLVVVLFET